MNLSRPLPAIIVSLGLSLILTVPAQARLSTAPQSTEGGRFIRVVASNTETAGHAGVHIAAAAMQADGGQIQIGDALVPGRVLALLVHDDATFDASLTAALAGSPIQSTPSVSDMQPGLRRLAALDAPQTASVGAAMLPTQAVTVLRDGRMRGQRIVVLAIAGRFQNGAQSQQLTGLDLSLDGASLLEDPSTLLDAAEALKRDAAILAVGAIPAPAPYPTATGPAWQLKVTRAGLQRITPAALSAAGLSASSTCVSYNGAALAIHEPGDGSVIFYASEPGDRYNSNAVYWVTGSGCPRMATTSNTAGSEQISEAFETGSWRQNAVYFSLQPGADNDHWFSRELRTVGTSTWTLSPAAAALPGGSGTSTYLVRGVTRTQGQYAATLSGNGINASQTWSGNGAFELTFSHAGNTLPTQLQLTQGAVAIVDDLSWQRRASLNFAGGAAAFLITTASSASQRYVLQNAGTATLYDVTIPAAPRLVTTAPAIGSPREFSSAANSRYILGGAATTTDHNALAAYTPARTSGGSLASQALNKRALWIAPASLANSTALAQLAAFRIGQGWTSEIIPVESIYDLWSFGHVSPEAIREFLQYQFSASNTKPEAVILVGDGNYDWRGFLDAGRTYARLIPPYMADVDRYRGELNISSPPPAETACDACYAQLDGNNPLDDFLPDLLYGRIPVSNTASLQTFVDKIIRYETLTTDLTATSWRSQAGYLVDNYWRSPEGQNIVAGQALPQPPIPDPAGPFWSFADSNIITAQALGPTIVRRYYDPYGKLGGVSYAVGAPQLSSNPPADAGKAMFNNGAGVITYIGHSNPQRMGQFEFSDPYGDGFLYDFQIPDLTNVDKLPIVLQMSCLTGSFHQHDPNGPNPGKETYLDERMVLQAGNKGAAAVWGSTGLGVMYGHQPLLYGFFRTYWRSYTVANPPTIGTAAMGGYLQLFADNGSYGEDSLRTFLITGDPLTRIRMFVPNAVPRERVITNLRLPLASKR